jgi:hypothetical protein
MLHFHRSNFSSKMKIHLLSTLVLCGGALLARPANAHFLWGQISESSDTPSFQVTLAEGSGEMTTTSLDKIKTAKAWSVSGAPLSLSVQGAALASSFDGTDQVAAAHQMYGVLDKTAQGRGVFLLEYEAKAARDISKAGLNAKLGLELFAHRDGSEVLATLKHNGKIVPNAVVKLHEPGADAEKPRDLTTNAQGQIRFDASESGLYGLRTTAVENTPGTFEGKKYDLLRRYTTLTFSVAPAQGATLKTVALAAAPAAEPMGNAKADPKAYALLKAAHDARQVLPVNFAGYTAKVTYRDGANKIEGTVRLEGGKKLEMSFPTATGDDKDWIEDTVGNIIGHRRGGTFATGDGKNPLTFGDSNEFGPLIELHDRFNSSYRVKDNKVTEVTREMGDSRFTISVVQTQEADPGKYISNHFTVAYRSKTTGELQKVDAFHDDYANWNKVWVPASRTVLTIDKAVTPRVRTLTFSDYKSIAPSTLAQMPVARATP